MNGATGFKPEVVNESIDGVKKAYESLMTTIGDDMQNQFVAGMAECWACNEAIDWFTKLQELYNPILSDAAQNVYAVMARMKTAGEGWAEQTGTTYSAPSISKIEKEMDIGSIQENIDGVRGIIEEEAKSTANKLPNILSEALGFLNNILSAISDCGFLGRDQATELNNLVSDVKSALEKAYENIMQSADKAINDTAEAYGNVGRDVSDVFSRRD